MPIRFPIPPKVVFAVVPVALAIPELDIPPVRQWGGEWCWAACAEMVFGFYKRPKAQCELVKQLFNMQTCCQGHPPDKPQPGCDRACFPDQVATLYGLGTNGLTATMETNLITFDPVKDEIGAMQPVEVEMFLNSSRHMILVRGAGKNPGGTEMIKYNDPWTAAAATDTFAHLQQAFAGHWWRKIRKS